MLPMRRCLPFCLMLPMLAANATEVPPVEGQPERAPIEIGAEDLRTFVSVLRAVKDGYVDPVDDQSPHPTGNEGGDLDRFLGNGREKEREQQQPERRRGGQLAARPGKFGGEQSEGALDDQIDDRTRQHTDRQQPQITPPSAGDPEHDHTAQGHHHSQHDERGERNPRRSTRPADRTQVNHLHSPLRGTRPR